MTTPHFGTTFAGLLPVITFFAGLFTDWFKQSVTRGFEARKQIGRVIADLLEVRHTAMIMREIPHLVEAILPEQLRNQIPPEAWMPMLNAASPLIPVDAQMKERYLKAVEELAGFEPVMAYGLRGKEQFFDFRELLRKHFGQMPGSSAMAKEIIDLFDRECLPAIDETLRLLAKSHSWRIRRSATKQLREQTIKSDPGIEAFREIIQRQLSQLQSAAETGSETGLGLK
jgi:hypothetical protein